MSDLSERLRREAVRCEAIRPLPLTPNNQERIFDDLEKILTEAAVTLADQAATIDELVRALEYARPLVLKWCFYQGNMQQFRDKTLDPIDQAIAKAKAKKGSE